VATAELLNKDTKPCPKCGTGIFKIDGCDQMWCTECHCAFNWQTGLLETGHVHNPHFFEFQRRMGTNMRNVQDMPCNAHNPDRYHGILRNLLDGMFNRTSKAMRASLNLPEIDPTQEMNIKQKTTDVTMSLPAFVTEMQRYRQDAIQNNMELRVKYLTEEFTDAQFRSYLFRDAKKFNVEREMGQVIQTVVFAMTDILTRMVDYLRGNLNLENTNISDPLVVLSMLSEVDVLMAYANECLAKICVEYKITRVGLFLRIPQDHKQAGLYSVAVSKTNKGEEIEPVVKR
jgi:ribosomal protein S27AE